MDAEALAADLAECEEYEGCQWWADDEHGGADYTGPMPGDDEEDE
jgi:hypothetical protein